MFTAHIASPVGTLTVVGSENGLRSISFSGRGPVSTEIPAALKSCATQLQEYFARERTSFTLPLDLKGTDFQKRVWQELLNIPYGVTRSYLDVALALGDSNAVRAVGTANGANPIAIVVPCHRVIGSSGKLVGYGGGLERKEWLLRFERNDDLFL